MSPFLRRDTLEGGPGNDKLDGSSGTDTAMNCGELEHKSTEIPPDGGCPPNYET